MVWGGGTPFTQGGGCSGSEAGSYLRLIDFVYHSTLGLRVINKRFMEGTQSSTAIVQHRVVQGYLAHKKQPTSLGLPQGPMHSLTVGS